MESYLETFSSGRFKPPSPDKIKEWLLDFGITPVKFSEIIGVDNKRVSRLLLPQNHSEHLDMKYSETRCFVFYLGLVAPVIIFPEKDIFVSLKYKLRDMKISIDEFCREYLGFSKTTYYQIKSKNPKELEELIKSKIDIE